MPNFLFKSATSRGGVNVYVHETIVIGVNGLPDILMDMDKRKSVVSRPAIEGLCVKWRLTADIHFVSMFNSNLGRQAWC